MMHFFYLLLTLCFSLLCVSATIATENYRLPPQDLIDLIDADPSPQTSFSPDGEWMLIIEKNEMPSVADLARRMLQLAGMRIDPVANGRFQSDFNRGLLLRKRGDSPQAATTRVPLPEGAKVARTSWSHSSQEFAFTLVTESGTQLWAASVENPGDPTMLTDRLSMVMTGFSWMPDANSILCCLVPTDRGEEPAIPVTPAGPSIQETSDNRSPTRTYQDLLKNAHDEALFVHYATTELVILDLNGQTKTIGQPALINGAEASPDGKHILVTTLHAPFSYLMTVSSFPRRIAVWDLEGTEEYVVADVPLAENIPIEGVRLGPRSVTWTSSSDSTLIWSAALDGGDPNVEAEYRDQWMACTAPFSEEPKPLVKSEHRAFNAVFLSDPDKLITYEYDRDRRWIRALLHDLSSSKVAPVILVDRSIRDRYGDPGRLVTEVNQHGHSVVRQHGEDGEWVFRTGSGATPEGALPFLDRQNLNTLKTDRLWRCEKGSYEAVVDLMDAPGNRRDENPVFVTQHQSPTSPPNYFLNRPEDLESPRNKLTAFPDPTPQIRGIRKELVKYQREDGVELSATMYLPADYKEGTRLPLMVWAYPIEFNDASTAGQVGGSPWLFTRIRGSSHLALATQGYAVMDGATIPIIGEPETMNDTFVEQMVAGAKAAVDKAVEMGVADRHRVAAGGHSYGAFMTANLMAHCDLFQAGIARSGAYNRTLTPFGFQSERRPLWEAKDVYFSISPFMHADRINEPLLLIHGAEDNNPGTFPIQSQRLFQAIKGNGGTAKLVMLPEESHGYRARESVMHVQAETVEWLDTHVKKAALPTAAATKESASPAS